MNIELKKFGTTLISRPAGKESFSVLQPSLKNIKEQEDLIIDFDGVITFSPSWGDEFLSPLIKLYGNKLKLKKTDNPSVLASLDILEESNKLRFNIIQ